MQIGDRELSVPVNLNYTHKIFDHIFWKTYNLDQFWKFMTTSVDDLLAWNQQDLLSNMGRSKVHALAEQT